VAAEPARSPPPGLLPSDRAPQASD